MGRGRGKAGAAGDTVSRADDFTPPTARQAEMDYIVVEESDPERGGKLTRSIAHPLDRYLHNFTEGTKGCKITEKQHDAGLKLMKARKCSGLASHYAQVKYDLEARGTAATGSAAEAYVEYCRAIDAVRGKTEQYVVKWVCCEGKYLGGCDAFTSTDSAERHGPRYLHAALDDLVKHYGLDKKHSG